MNQVLLLICVFLISVVGGFIYLKIASVNGPYAIPNYRSLHRKVIAKGGGLVVAVSVLGTVLFYYLRQSLPLPYLMVFFVGGILVTLAGFTDDYYDMRPKYRLAIQLMAAIWICYWFKPPPSLNLGFINLNLGKLSYVFIVISFLWFYNLYNFIDGIDGMAASATIFISSTMGIILMMEKQYDLALVLGLLAVANIGFIQFNWPPAKMFLGDSGTSFTSYMLSGVGLVSLVRDAVSIWLWLVVFAYYFSDTTTTTGIRALTVPRWYLAHRSHAYQNLARVWNSHLKTLLLVLTIDLFWVLPFALLVWKYPENAAFATVIAYAPLILFCVKYGPLYEDK